MHRVVGREVGLELLPCRLVAAPVQDFEVLGRFWQRVERAVGDDLPRQVPTLRRREIGETWSSGPRIGRQHRLHRGADGVERWWRPVRGSFDIGGPGGESHPGLGQEQISGGGFEGLVCAGLVVRWHRAGLEPHVEVEVLDLDRLGWVGSDRAGHDKRQVRGLVLSERKRVGDLDGGGCDGGAVHESRRLQMLHDGGVGVALGEVRRGSQHVPCVVADGIVERAVGDRDLQSLEISTNVSPLTGFCGSRRITITDIGDLPLVCRRLPSAKRHGGGAETGNPRRGDQF